METLPAQWLFDFGQAVIMGDGEPVLALIDRIRPDHSELAESLAKLVKEFRYDKLIALTEGTQKGET